MVNLDSKFTHLIIFHSVSGFQLLGILGGLASDADAQGTVSKALGIMEAFNVLQYIASMRRGFLPHYTAVKPVPPLTAKKSLTFFPRQPVPPAQIFVCKLR